MKINSFPGLAIICLFASSGLRADDKAPAPVIKKAPAADPGQPVKKKVGADPGQPAIKKAPAVDPGQPVKKKVAADPGQPVKKKTPADPQLVVKKKDPAVPGKPVVKKENFPGKPGDQSVFDQVRKADENNDGFVTLAEFEKNQPAGKDPAKMAAWFKDHDRDADGKLSSEDFAPAPFKKKL